MLDEYDVEVDQRDRERVVLAAPALRLIVFGRTLVEAEAWARAAITFREHTLATLHLGHQGPRPMSPRMSTRLVRRARMPPEVGGSLG